MRLNQFFVILIIVIVVSSFSSLLYLYKSSTPKSEKEIVTVTKTIRIYTASNVNTTLYENSIAEWERFKKDRNQTMVERIAAIESSYISNNKGDFKSNRPANDARKFTSDVIEKVIEDVKSKMKDKELAWMFENCFPNTLDTTVFYEVDSATKRPSTFVITGDINAMWLRDSTNQIWPYLQFLKEDKKLEAMAQGLIFRQAEGILVDPYANAFLKDKTKIGYGSDVTKMMKGVHERKYELDSLASFIRLSVGYYEATESNKPFQDDIWRNAVNLTIDTIIENQDPNNPKYTFQRRGGAITDTLLHGKGNAGIRCGLSRSPFRPSDDSSIFPFPIAANAMAKVWTEKMIDLGLLDFDKTIKEKAKTLVDDIENGIQAWGIINHPVYGLMFAYEVDGIGSQVLMDDANIPSVLSLPYLGYVTPDDPVYKNTREFLLSTNNPWFFNGTAAEGIGGSHAHGYDYIWHMSIIMRGLTSESDVEIKYCLAMLKSTHDNRGFMHESFHKSNPKSFTRVWFAWVNTMYGELILKIAKERPHLIFE